jgi:16S rRNA U1498 N3-methylase RsmE
LSDYHQHAEHIVNTLVACAQCYSKTNDHIRAIQFTTEALQYNKKDSNALIYRAKAFENEKLYVLINRKNTKNVFFGILAFFSVMQIMHEYQRVIIVILQHNKHVKGELIFVR